MCQLDNDQMEAVQEVVADLTSHKKIFTSYDVTKIVRKRSNLGNVRHRDGVGELVHNMFNNQSPEFPMDYDKSYVFIPSINADVNVFHPVGSDPTCYDTDTTDTDTTDTDGSTDTDTTDTDTTDTDGSTDGTKVDKRGRLCVRKKYLDEIGATVGDTLVVVPLTDDNGNPILHVLSTTFCYVSGRLYHRFFPSHHGFRISRRTLNAYLPNSKVFKIELNENKDAVVISVP